MSKSVLDIGGGKACPSCDAHNFMLFRAGQIGTAMLFEQYDLTGDSFDWVEGHENGYNQLRVVKQWYPLSDSDGVAARLRKALADK
jgi:hypothetical protein